MEMRFRKEVTRVKYHSLLRKCLLIAIKWEISMVLRIRETTVNQRIETKKEIPINLQGKHLSLLRKHLLLATKWEIFMVLVGIRENTLNRRIETKKEIPINLQAKTPTSLYGHSGLVNRRILAAPQYLNMGINKKNLILPPQIALLILRMISRVHHSKSIPVP
jgi:hypothetical protein